MSTAAKMQPQELRASLHRKIDTLADEELEMDQCQIDVLGLKREFDAIGEEMAEDWRTGRITREKVDEAVRAYRATESRHTSARP